MSKNVPKSGVNTASAATDDEPTTPAGVSRLRKAMLYLLVLVSGGAFGAAVYFLRLDTFIGWEKALVDLFMVTVAITFLISLYMTVDATFRGSDKGWMSRTGS